MHLFLFIDDHDIFDSEDPIPSDLRKYLQHNQGNNIMSNYFYMLVKYIYYLRYMCCNNTLQLIPNYIPLSILQII